MPSCTVGTIAAWTLAPPIAAIVPAANSSATPGFLNVVRVRPAPIPNLPIAPMETTTTATTPTYNIANSFRPTRTWRLPKVVRPKGQPDPTPLDPDET